MPRPTAAQAMATLAVAPLLLPLVVIVLGALQPVSGTPPAAVYEDLVRACREETGASVRLTPVPDTDGFLQRLSTS